MSVCVLNFILTTICGLKKGAATLSIMTVRIMTHGIMLYSIMTYKTLKTA
jgi:hypothetical protein